MTRWALLALLFAVPQEDKVAEAIESAQVKARAGRIEEALTLLDGLVKEHDSDPRVHYQRSLVLQQLNRLGASSDAVERAEETLAARLKAGEKSETILALKDAITRRADDMLANRRTVRVRLTSYRTKAVVLCEVLIEAKHGDWAGYVLRELRSALESWDDDLAKLEKRAAAWTGIARSERNPSDADLAQADKNVAEAQKALKSKDVKEARLSALAALERVPEHCAALAALGEALTGLKKPDEAVVAYLGALDAPKRNERDLAALVRRLKKSLRELSASLADFVDERTDAADAVVALRKRAAKASRTFDVTWIDDVLRRLAPAEPAVEAVIGITTGKRPEAKRTSEVPSGFRDLMDGVDWLWKNKGGGARTGDGELVLAMEDEASPKALPLPAEFTLRFELNYEIEEKQEPWLRVNFEASAASGNTANALIFFPQGDHTFAFASAKSGKGWGLRNKGALPKGKLTAGAWCAVEIAWSDAKKRLRLSVGGDEVLDATLEGSDALQGVWSFGLGGAAKSARVRRVLLKGE